MAPMSSGARGSRTPGGAQERIPSAPEVEEDSIDPVPEEVRDAARRAFDARLSGVPVADLVFDSLLDDDLDDLTQVPSDASADPAGPASDDSPRRLRFCLGQDATQNGVLVTVGSVDDLLHLSVQLTPGFAAALELRGAGEPMHTETGDDGRAEVDVPPGMVSLLVRPLDAELPSMQTAWVRL